MSEEQSSRESPITPTQIQNIYHYPYQISKTNNIGPDNPQFHSFNINVVILTKYGRFVFLRNGNQQKCSSFFATLITIVNKLQMSFGSINNPAKLKKIKQGNLQFYVIKRLNFIYIFWMKGTFSDLRLFSMIEMLHYQLMSSLTSKVNSIIDNNQTYDPTVNFGKSSSNTIVNLLQYAQTNGLHGLPILFNAIPILIMSNQDRNIINSILNVKDYKTDGLQVSFLMTMNSIIGISKKKQINIVPKDIFLFFILLQGQSSLSKSQNWFPICLPGIQPQSMIFCYINYIDINIIHVMISDETKIFPILSQINKSIKNKLQQNNLINKINQASLKNLKDLVQTQKLWKLLMKHFIVRNQSCDQFIISDGQYFGDNSNICPEFHAFHNTYAQLYQHLLTVKHCRKQKLHVQTFKDYIGGYYEQGTICLFFITSKLSDLKQSNNIMNSILKLLKNQQTSYFILKY